MSLSARFWGVRGSVPSPLTPLQVEEKQLQLLKSLNGKPAPVGSDADLRQWLRQRVSFATRSTYGGNTTCVEVRAGGELIILDMGTGLRELGRSLMPETLKQGGIKGTILQSHVHWDHIQGYPFWPHIYMPRRKIKNEFSFYGGRQWDESLLTVLRGQMDPPRFPVDHGEIEEIGLGMNFNTVHDGLELKIGSGQKVIASCRKLNHPQETYGYRIEHGGKVLVFCTDHEPYAGIHQPLVELAQNADIFITDCQYTYHQYLGGPERKGVQKLGWGHSYPEYIAEVARLARVKRIITTHHDPDADEAMIEEIAHQVQKLSGIPTTAAHEGGTVVC